MDVLHFFCSRVSDNQYHTCTAIILSHFVFFLLTKKKDARNNSSFCNINDCAIQWPWQTIVFAIKFESVAGYRSHDKSNMNAQRRKKNLQVLQAWLFKNHRHVQRHEYLLAVGRMGFTIDVRWMIFWGLTKKKGWKTKSRKKELVT